MQTDAERALWFRLRSRQLNGFKFRRQYPIGRFIVDFCCAEQGLVIELDGGQHVLQAQADAQRTAYLNQAGYRVRRYWDHEVLRQPDVVLEDILRTLQESHPHPPLSLVRERVKRRQGEDAERKQ